MKMPTRKTIIISLVAVLVIGSALLYFFSWRPGGSDYDVALQQLNNLKQSTASVGDITKASDIPYAYTSPYVITMLTNAKTQYDKAYDALDQSSITARDSTVHDIYGRYKASLQSYKQSLADLVDSVAAFNTLTTTCSQLQATLKTITNTSDFATASKKCTDAIAAAKSAPDETFKTQFLTAYSDKAAAVVTAYGKYIAAGSNSAAQTAAIAEANAKTNEMTVTRSTALNLTRSPSITDALQKLVDTISSQKGAFFK